MGCMPSTPLADAPYAVLDSAARAGDKALELHLPPLEPELYVRVKEALNRLNARWVKRRGTHVFGGTREEGEARLDLALRTRRLPDRNPLAFFPTPAALADEVARIVEEAFGWGKTIGGLARPMRKGKARMGFVFTFTMAAYDLVRLPRLFAEANA